MTYYRVVKMEKDSKISKIPDRLLDKHLRGALENKLDKYIVHSRDLQLQKKWKMDLNLPNIVKQIKDNELMAKK